MKLDNAHIAVLMLFAGIFVSQNAPKVYAQNSQLINLQTGKPIERKNLPRFTVTSSADGAITRTNIKFYSSLIETNDEQNIKTSATSKV